MSSRRSSLINTFVFAALPTVLRVPEQNDLLFVRVCVCICLSVCLLMGGLQLDHAPGRERHGWKETASVCCRK